MANARSSARSLTAVGLCFLMCMVVFSPMVPPVFEPDTSPQRATYYIPSGTETGVNTTNTNVLSIPYNQTFSGGQLDVTPMWSGAADTSSRFGIDGRKGWNGSHQGTQGIGHGGQLSLATQSTVGTLTDFETLIATLPDWVGQGPNHNTWNVVHPNTSSTSVNQPSSATEGQHVLATQALGGLGANMSGCLASPQETVPAFVNQYNLTLDHWLSFLDDDAAWVESRLSGGSWQVLSPSNGYTNASTLTGAPTNVWSGASNSWQRAHFSLDALVTSSLTVEIRFCFKTSETAGMRHGWFLDNYTFSNLGDAPGAWFHGNMSGNYANNADGRLYLPANLSGYSGPMQLEFWANWDLEGSYYDNLLVLVSLNNGTTWAPVSGIPGLPGNGLSYQGRYYTDESLGWIPITYNLPSGVSGHPNASRTLFQFQVVTNYQNGYGGFASSGWEGVAIDDVTVIHRPGTAQAERLQVANFSVNSSGQYGDQRGWLDPSPSYVNEWNWTTDFGMNPSQASTNSFENSIITPPGWSIEGTWPDGWEVGQTRNTSGYGPGLFYSGQNGAAINLTTKYTNNVYTHLVTEEYTIPTNATARLSFRSWVCTEANWDGGGVSISTDEGLSWWWLPAEVNGFHDQVSTVNTNSPFFGRGIIDGSSVVGGCGSSNNRDFELKTYDLSNLSGQTLKARFSFFSDTYVEADGWYIDDAGIEIDLFETSGTWVSPAIAPDPLFGYGWLDGWFEQPNGTQLLFDVLDASKAPIEGLQNLTLPAYPVIDTVEHPSVHVRVRMSTDDVYVTPLVHSMSFGRTTYIGPQHVMNTVSGSANALVDDNGTLNVVGAFSTPLFSPLACPFDGYRITTFGDNLTWATPNGQLVASAHVPGRVKTTYLNHSLGGDIATTPAFTLVASGGEQFIRAKAELDCVLPPTAPHLSIGWNNVSVMEWPPNGMDALFGLNTQWTSVVHNGLNMTAGNNTAHPIIATNNSSLTLSFVSIDRQPQGSSTGVGPAFNLMLSNVSVGTVVRINGGVQPIPGEYAVVHYQSTQSCPNVASSQPHPSFNAYVLTCSVNIEVQGAAEVHVGDLLHMLPDTTLEVSVSSTALNAAKSASLGQDVREVLEVPLHVKSLRGGLRVGLNATTLPLMVEEVDAPTYTRWLPEETVSFTSHHTRYNPLNPTEDAPDISAISLYLSGNADLEQRLVHVQVDRIQQAPRFRQLGGAGLAPLDMQNSSVSCSTNTCSVTWSFSSTWLLNDVDDLHVLVSATDEDGLEVGPKVFVRKTAFNEIENDLEVVDFTVNDVSSRRIDDWTNSFWPFHLNHSQALEAKGRVRMEGIANQWVNQGEAEATVTMRAVPPKNLTGGSDEWPGTPVVWSQSWQAEVGPGGWFTVPISTPSESDAVPSNTFLEIVPSLSRRGPIDAITATSDDRTVVLTPTRFLHDTVSPQVDSLTVLDAGREVPADEHITMYGKDVALRLEISDQEGLASQLEVWTWLESLHDSNNDGVPQSTEYAMQTVSLNRGARELEVDLPLIASENVVPNGANSGLLSVVLVGQDLAGNPLDGGGDFGTEHDLATLSVQRRADTVLDVDSITLDRQSGFLFAGNEHRFSFTLGDANGLGSLDAIELALLGEQNESSCFIHYLPRFAEIQHDGGCFVESPSVSVEQRPLANIYDISVAFRLTWNATRDLGQQELTPSLKVFDEGQDLGLGLYSLNSLSWMAHDLVELRWIEIVDTQQPYGQDNGSTYWFHRNDKVQHSIGLYHHNTTILARDFPQTGQFEWILSDGERTGGGVVNLTTNGRVDFDVYMNENVLYSDTGEFIVAPTGFEGYIINPISYGVVVDDVAPRVVIAAGVLNNYASNAMTAVPISVSVNDDTDMPPTALEMHTQISRVGQIVEGSQQVVHLPIARMLNDFTVYEDVVDFVPAGVELTSSDVLIVWFNATDRSGRSLVGRGSPQSPITVGITWFAFEPEFTETTATPYRPVLGDNISIYARVANDGLLGGEVRVVLRDDLGKELGNGTAYLDKGEYKNFVWNIEAWKEGRLLLTLEIENHSLRIPVPLAEIRAQDPSSSAGDMAMFSLSVLAFVVAGMVLFVVRQRRAQRDEIYHLERIKRIVSLRRPPPKPWDLSDTSREE